MFHQISRSFTLSEEDEEKQESRFPLGQDFKVLPDGGMDDLVQQVVVKAGGWRKPQKLHSEWGDET